MLSIQPILKIQYQENQQTLKDKIITIRVYKYVEINTLIEDMLISGNQSMQTFNSLLDDYKNNKSNSSNDVITILSNMWTVASNAGKLNIQTSQPFENLNISFTHPNETSDSLFAFKDISIQFQNYGKYQILFIIDGIESPLSKVIEITQIPEIIKKNNVIYKLFVFQ